MSVGFLSANKMPLRSHEMMYVFYEKLPTYKPQKTEGKPYTAKRSTANKTYPERSHKVIETENTGDRHPTSVVRPEEEQEMPPASHEMVYVFYEKLPTYNPQKTEGKPYNCKQGKNIRVYGKGEEDITTENTGERHPTSILKADNVYGKTFKATPDPEGKIHPKSILQFSNGKKHQHPTQKPVELCEWLIKSYSNGGDLVLDFTMGSGTTGVACMNTQRRFVGVEMDEAYFNICVERIDGDPSP